MAGFSLTGLDQVNTLRAKIAKAITGVPNEVKAVNRGWVPKLRAALIAHSSGRPGPMVQTGAYNANYVVETAEGEMGVEAGNSSPQSNRLEYGFVGVDATGRHYQQQPFPHFRPTLEEVTPEYAKDIGDAFPRWWGK
jgi:hypothetical protein